jgi:malate dehydrogenase (oxaloacetate-decarboxylating)
MPLSHLAETNLSLFSAICELATAFGQSDLCMVIPKPFDRRVVPHVARRVAEAAVKSGVSRFTVEDFDAYEESVAKRIAAARGEK